ncbi:kinesin [Halorussus halobius]|uniref:kinesin n=1 Tax=Halorussus halobius TaxID=1710537 RepID=UPI001092916C|nr:kinesin [Halorussus halobius]
MSKTSTPNTTSDRDALTDDEQSVFERLADRYDDDSDVGRIAELVLQSSKEDANS